MSKTELIEKIHTLIPNNKSAYYHAQKLTGWAYKNKFMRLMYKNGKHFTKNQLLVIINILEKNNEIRK